MSEPTDQPVPTYQPAQHIGSNVDLQALVQQAVAAALDQERARLGIAAPEPVKSAEQVAREALDRAGATVDGAAMGHDERLAELYKIVALIASKVGI